MVLVLTIILIIAAAQGFFLMLHFLFKKGNTPSLNKLIALVNFCFFLLLVNTSLAANNIVISSNFFQDIVNNSMWFVGPSLYLYVIYDETISNKEIKLHLAPYLLPFFIDILYDWDFYDSIIIYIAHSQMLIYLMAALYFCYKNYKHQKTFFSWVLPAIISFMLIVAINFALNVFGTLAYKLVSNTIQQSMVIFFVIPIFYIAFKEMNSKSDFGLQNKKYSTTPLGKQKREDFLKKIITALEAQQLYKDTELTLGTFSVQVGILPKYVSQTINETKNLSFPDLINQYRIEDVKKSLVNPDNKDFTILGIARDSGFKSGSRFNALFKKYTGVTPSEFRKKHI